MFASMDFPTKCLTWAGRSWQLALAGISSTWAATLFVLSGLAAIWVINHWSDLLFGVH